MIPRKNVPVTHQSNNASRLSSKDNSVSDEKEVLIASSVYGTKTNNLHKHRNEIVHVQSSETLDL